MKNVVYQPFETEALTIHKDVAAAKEKLPLFWLPYLELPTLYDPMDQTPMVVSSYVYPNFSEIPFTMPTYTASTHGKIPDNGLFVWRPQISTETVRDGLSNSLLMEK